MRLIGDGAPLGQVVRSLLLDVGLRVDAMLASELLCDWVLDFDSLDLFAQVGE